MDQLKALEWVMDNISAFGGDPGNITVGGQSGGSTKAGAMAFTPASKGRIRRTILESGLKWMQRFPTIAEMEGRGRDYPKRSGSIRMLRLRRFGRSILGSCFRPGRGKQELRCPRRQGKWSGTGSFFPISI